MAVKHIVRKDGDGKTREVALTPLKSIRLNCIECMGFQPSLVRECSSPLCPLYPFRMGRGSRRPR
ncbi:MAG: hypothetical protein JXL84_04915 [Deltaproteobacteria bacterium]|nr:hypothetical protein [Deltaproteobacteria bacterium]